MGFEVEFNWILKLKPEQGFPAELKPGIYDFSKSGYRIYPIGSPIELVTENWEAVGLAKVLESTMKEQKTSGRYEIIRVYDSEERELKTKQLRETVELQKGKVEFKSYSIT